MKRLSSAMAFVNWRTSYDDGGDGDEEEKSIAVGVEPGISIMRKKDIDSMTHDVNLASADVSAHEHDVCFMNKIVKGKRRPRIPAVFGPGTICKNMACKAVVRAGASFCKRCSCVLCKAFDENKDPSVWIVCERCGLSCHVECALQEGVAGVIMDGKAAISHDGSYQCPACRHVTCLIGFWKKQLLLAKDARRVDVLCRRLLLSHRLLHRTAQFKEAHSLVLEAVKKLDAEVRLMTQVSVKLERCIVNRLACNADVRKLIDLALVKAEQLRTNTSLKEIPNGDLFSFHFEDACSPTMVVVVVNDYSGEKNCTYKLWHRKGVEDSYPRSPTWTSCSTSKRALVKSLQLSTRYMFKLISFSRGGLNEYEAEYCTKNSESPRVDKEAQRGNLDCAQRVLDKELDVSRNQSSAAVIDGHAEGIGHTRIQVIEEMTRKGTATAINMRKDDPKYVSSHLLSGKAGQKTSHLANFRRHDTNIANGDSSVEHWLMQIQCKDKEAHSRIFSERIAERDLLHMIGGALNSRPNKVDFLVCMDGSVKMDGQDSAKIHDFDFTVKVVRWLECQGHISSEFRMKFLTWYGLRASAYERRAVCVFVRNFKDNPDRLATQLVDTFQGVINSKRQKQIFTNSCSNIY